MLQGELQEIATVQHLGGPRLVLKCQATRDIVCRKTGRRHRYLNIYISKKKYEGKTQSTYLNNLLVTLDFECERRGQMDCLKEYWRNRTVENWNCGNFHFLSYLWKEDDGGAAEMMVCQIEKWDKRKQMKLPIWMRDPCWMYVCMLYDHFKYNWLDYVLCAGDWNDSKWFPALQKKVPFHNFWCWPILIFLAEMENGRNIFSWLGSCKDRRIKMKNDLIKDDIYQSIIELRALKDRVS